MNAMLSIISTSDFVTTIVVIVAVLGMFLLLPGLLLGMVIIRETQVGVVVKKFAGTKLAPGRLIALDGEAGYQAETLAPGFHFGYWMWQYRIFKAPATLVPQGEIALVVAADGASIPSER